MMSVISLFEGDNVRVTTYYKRCCEFNSLPAPSSTSPNQN